MAARRQKRHPVDLLRCDLWVEMTEEKKGNKFRTFCVLDPNKWCDDKYWLSWNGSSQITIYEFVDNLEKNWKKRDIVAMEGFINSLLICLNSRNSRAYLGGDKLPLF